MSTRKTQTAARLGPGRLAVPMLAHLVALTLPCPPLLGVPSVCTAAERPMSADAAITFVRDVDVRTAAPRCV